MKALILSDLHIEFARYKLPQNIECDVVIVAGDSANSYLSANMYREMISCGYTILLVPGNHEYYNKSIEDVDAYWRNMELQHRGKFYFLNNQVREIQGVRFVGSTLWGKIKPQNEYQIKSDMNDFRRIRKSPSSPIISPSDMNDMHTKSRHFIMDNLCCDDVLITHHLPLWKSVDERYKSNPLNEAYVGDIEDIITTVEPQLVIHGHSHIPVDYMVNKTRILSNPRGYVGTDKNDKFDPGLVVDIR